MTFKKGEKKPNQGKRGPGKITVELKTLILGALDEAGGQSYLVERALDPKTASAFLTLVGKVLPMTIDGQASLTIHWPVAPPSIER